MEATVWKPNVRQELALSCPYPEIGFGGSRGGGKTEGGLAFLTQDIEHPHLRQLVVRKNWEDLKEWISRAEAFFAPLGAKYRDGDFYWPKGGILRTGHFKDDKAFQKYVGHEYQRILVEELNLIPREENYQKLFGSLRSKYPELATQMMSTFNPSDEGFYWIKKRFKLHGIPRDPVVTRDPRTGLLRAFIPSRIDDNPFLASDPNYNAFLNGLPDGLREAWRDGSWDEPQIQGAYYTMEMLQADREERIKVVPIDKLLKVHTVWDLGISKGNAMTVGCVQRVKGETRIVHYYENEGFGLGHYFAHLQEWQREQGVQFGRHFAPHDIKNRERTSGKSTKVLARAMGWNFEDVPNVDIKSGIEHVRLMFPRLWFNKPACEQLLSALRNYKKTWNEKRLMFDAEPFHDWASNGADMIRYLALVEELLTNEDVVHYKQDAYVPHSELEVVDGKTLDDFRGDDGSFGKQSGPDIGRLHRKT